MFKFFGHSIGQEVVIKKDCQVMAGTINAKAVPTWKVVQEI